MITVYIIRHGNTIFNALRRLQGQLDSPLAKEGINDAKVLGKRLRSIHFDAIIASDLGRAKQTVSIIKKIIKHKKKIILSK
ncbi:histidine phosphatase family protein, partial [Candidatus Woesearchaeota archaeon]|nr:histidine phosphatase family protein [Candidatus Woesearchaeota archaeon]